MGMFFSEAFMEEVSKDAERRYKDKMVRKERMETFKKQASLAFRRGEYERALNCYNKVSFSVQNFLFSRKIPFMFLICFYIYFFNMKTL